MSEIEKKEYDELKKLIQSTTSARKTVKDVKTSILQDVLGDIGNDCRKGD